jgi:hypothetical protein
MLRRSASSHMAVSTGPPGGIPTRAGANPVPQQGGRAPAGCNVQPRARASSNPGRRTKAPTCSAPPCRHLRHEARLPWCQARVPGGSPRWPVPALPDRRRPRWDSRQPLGRERVEPGGTDEGRGKAAVERRSRASSLYLFVLRVDERRTGRGHAAPPTGVPAAHRGLHGGEVARGESPCQRGTAGLPICCFDVARRRDAWWPTPALVCQPLQAASCPLHGRDGPLAGSATRSIP